MYRFVSFVSKMPSRVCMRGLSSAKSAVCIGFDAPLDILMKSEGSTQQLTKGQVRVKVAAAAINFADILQCKGKYQVFMIRIMNDGRIR